MRAVALVFGLLLLIGSGSKAEDAPEEVIPRGVNVILVIVDDLNDWVGVMGGREGMATPHLDALAGQGVLFQNAHAAAPACNPSRTALLTGVRPSTSGVYENNQPWRAALPDAVTLPRHFKTAGYRMLTAGKTFHGRYQEKDLWDKRLRLKPPPRRAPGPRGSGRNKSPYAFGPVDAPDEQFLDRQVVDWAVERLAEETDTPFFMALGLVGTHLPFEAPKQYFDRFPVADIVLPEVRPDDLDDVPPAGRKLARPDREYPRIVRSGLWKETLQAYLATIAFLDDCVGRLMAGLSESRHRENTIIVFVSDHGWHFGEKLHWSKHTLWEESTRIPLIIAGPGVGGAGQHCLRPASLLDVYPTLVELCGLPPVAALEGVSLVPWLLNPEASRDDPVLMTMGRGNHAVRSGRWRYIRYEDGTEELYDHEHDPDEWKNLASLAKYAEVKAELAKKLPKLDAPPAAEEEQRRR